MTEQYRSPPLTITRFVRLTSLMEIPPLDQQGESLSVYQIKGSFQRQSSENRPIGVGFRKYGGEGGIRTLGTGISQYNGLANRRIRPLCHLSD